MNKKYPPYLSLITQEYIDNITYFYPEIDISKVSNLVEKNGNLTFSYEERSYFCVLKKIKKQLPSVQEVIQTQGDILNSVLNIMKAGHTQTQNINYCMLEGVKHIIGEYYLNLDFEHVKDIHISGGHILFRYYRGIYMCPVKHMYEFQNGQSLKEEVVKISELIHIYYPQIDTKFINNIIIEHGLIGFQYLSEKYFCPLQAPETLVLQCEKVRILEEEFQKEYNKSRPAKLKRIK